MQSGQKVKKAVFVETRVPAYDRIVIQGALTQMPVAAREVLEKARAERKREERQRPAPASVGAPAPPVAEPHPAIRKTAQTLRKARPNSAGSVRAFGDGLCGLEVSSAQAERAIAFLDALARGLETKGLALKPNGQAMMVADGPDNAIFTLKERTRSEPHIPTEAERAAEEKRRQRLERASGGSSWSFDFPSKAYPDFDTAYMGELAFQIDGYSDGVRRRWADGKTQTVETLLDSIITGIMVLLAARKAVREEREERQRQWEEMARRRGLARQRQEREEKRLTYLRSVLDLSDELARLRAWLREAMCLRQSGSCGENLLRLIAWATERERALAKALEAERLDADLLAKQLFPGEDTLHDPLGEPPSESRYW